MAFRFLLAATLALSPAAAAAPSARIENRCGWIDNPTPANWWLTDRNGEWTIMVQGGYQAEGWEDMPDMSARGWKETNGHHGYGCGCVKGIFDLKSGRVLRIVSARPLPLNQCSSDRSLPRR